MASVHGEPRPWPITGISATFLSLIAIENEKSHRIFTFLENVLRNGTSLSAMNNDAPVSSYGEMAWELEIGGTEKGGTLWSHFLRFDGRQMNLEAAD